MEHDTINTIVLAGGGIKGFIELGSIYYLYEHVITPNKIVNYYATSIGAVISYLLILQYNPINILSYLCQHKILTNSDINLVNIPENGLYDWNIFGEHIVKLTLEKLNFIPTLSQLYEIYKVNFVCVSYNRTKNKIEYISHQSHPDLSCIMALRMTTSLPLIFTKCIYNGNVYVDGGIADNFPIEYATKDSEKRDIENKKVIIGIDFQTDKVDNIDNKNETGIKKIINEMYSIFNIPLSVLQDMKNSFYSEEKNANIKIISLKSSTSALNFTLSTRDMINVFSDGYIQTKDIFENHK